MARPLGQEQAHRPVQQGGPRDESDHGCLVLRSDIRPGEHTGFDEYGVLVQASSSDYGCLHEPEPAELGKRQGVRWPRHVGGHSLSRFQDLRDEEKQG